MLSKPNAKYPNKLNLIYRIYIVKKYCKISLNRCHAVKETNSLVINRSNLY